MSSQKPNMMDQLLLDERYELLSVIGRGGNSLVYTARPTVDARLSRNLPEIVTVKIFSSSSSEILERIQREAMLMKSLNHPRVLKIFDYAATMELSYLVMEYASRGDIKGLLEERGKLEQGVALRFAVQALDALQAVHAAGIIHRDVKPENLLILEDGSIRLSDFGVSTLMGDDPFLHDESNIVRGTLGYIAPEQLQGFTETVQSDIFASAVAIFEMLSGKLPYEGNSLTDLLDAMLQGRALKLREILGEEYSEIDEVLAKGLKTNPAERYSSALEFRRAIEKVIWTLESAKATHGSRKLAQVELPSKHTPIEILNSELAVSPRKRILSAVSVGVVMLWAITFLLIGKNSATANLRRNAPSQSQSVSQGILGIFSKQEPESGFEQVKILSESPRAGVIFNLLGDGQNVFFSTAPVRTIDGVRENEFILSLGLSGFKPQLIAISPEAKSRELLISAGGMRLMLEISKENLEQDSILGGKFKDLNTGRESRWAVF